MKYISCIWVSYWMEADRVFKSWGARKVSFLGKGTHKPGFAKLRGKPGRGRVEHCKHRKEYVYTERNKMQELWGRSVLLEQEMGKESSGHKSSV